MRKYFICFVCLMCSVITYGQNVSDPNYDTKTKMIYENYNSGNYKSIYDEFSTEMKNAVSFDNYISGISQISNQYGKINKKEFRIVENGWHIYGIIFEHGNLDMKLVLDKSEKIIGWTFVPSTDYDIPVLERNQTELILPFKDEWYVFWGGDTKEQNQHIDSRFQKDAFDFLIMNEQRKSYKTGGQTNEDYYAFGKEIISPCDGIITDVIDGVRDNKPSDMNSLNLSGNTIILKTNKNEYLFFGHFMIHSIRVKVAEAVKQGQVLGLCGNSGNSSEPHLHFHIQNTDNTLKATGAKCYFKKIEVRVKGLAEEKIDYSPVKGEIVINKK